MSYITASERQTLLSTDLAGARSQGMFVQSLERITMAFGFSHFLIFNAPANADTLLSSLIIETSMPMQLLKEFDRAQLLTACRALMPARDSVMPTTWQLSDSRSPAGTDVPCKLRSFLIDRDLHSNFVFSVFSAKGQRLAFWFCGDRSSLSQTEVNELCMLVLQATTSYSVIRRNSAALMSALSAREIEVIRWTAQGKTSIEIAQILTLSDHTVNAYMTNAIKKLACVNRTQLVAQAIRMKLIN